MPTVPVLPGRRLTALDGAWVHVPRHCPVSPVRPLFLSIPCAMMVGRSRWFSRRRSDRILVLGLGKRSASCFLAPGMTLYMEFTGTKSYKLESPAWR